MGRTTLAAMTAALAALPPVAGAEQDLATPEPTRMREVSVTATRTERTTDDVPATVTTIDAEDMKHGLVREIRDLIRYEPGYRLPNWATGFRAPPYNRLLW